MQYSVQQIKFEFLSYIKEFGGTGSDWFIGLAEGSSGEDISKRTDISQQRLIWICKPALSARAAVLVHDHMVARHQVRSLDHNLQSPGKSWVFLCREDRGPNVI